MIRQAVLASRPSIASPYQADAVHCDGSTFLSIGSLSAGADNGKLTFAVWVGGVTDGPNWGDSIWIVDPAGAYATYLQPTQLALLAADGSTGVTTALTPALTDGVWKCFIGSVDGHAQNAALYRSTEDVTLPFHTSPSGSFTPPLNGQPFYVITDTFFAGIYDMAIFQFWAGVSIVESDNTITSGNRGLFINGDGKPVDPAVAALALGTPTILFNGDDSTFGTNQGTGGTFTTTGTFTNASSSPSD